MMQQLIFISALRASIPAYEQLVSKCQYALILLLKLDSSGLSETDFRKLFTICHCGVVMTRRVFRDHICTTAPPVIILTSDTSDDEAQPSGPIFIDLTADSDR